MRTRLPLFSKFFVALRTGVIRGALARTAGAIRIRCFFEFWINRVTWCGAASVPQEVLDWGRVGCRFLVAGAITCAVQASVSVHIFSRAAAIVDAVESLGLLPCAEM